MPSDPAHRDRKVQNRVAQREFRERKAQHLKELEAKVSIAESTRDEQLESYRVGMRAVMEENQKLRDLLAAVSGFIVRTSSCIFSSSSRLIGCSMGSRQGEGMGSCLPRLELTSTDFKEFLSRAKTDLAIAAIGKARDDRASSIRADGSTSSNQDRPSLAKKGKTAVSFTGTACSSAHTDSPPTSVYLSPLTAPLTLNPIETTLKDSSCEGMNSTACLQGIRTAFSGDLTLANPPPDISRDMIKAMYSQVS